MDKFRQLEVAGETLDTLVDELHDPVGRGKQRIVRSARDVRSWTNREAALADEDVAVLRKLPGVLFGTQALTL